jgi:hypothetical protein
VVEEVRECVRGLLAAGRQESEEGEGRLRVGEGDVGGLAAEPQVPAEGGAFILLRGPVATEEYQLERFHGPDLREIGGRGEGFGEVVVVEGSSEAGVGRACAVTNMFAH